MWGSTLSWGVHPLLGVAGGIMYRVMSSLLDWSGEEIQGMVRGEMRVQGRVAVCDQFDSIQCKRQLGTTA